MYSTMMIALFLFLLRVEEKKRVCTVSKIDLKRKKKGSKQIQFGVRDY
jgi:hypothetical protein